MCNVYMWVGLVILDICIHATHIGVGRCSDLGGRHFLIRFPSVLT